MKKYYDSQLIYNQQRDIDCVVESNEVFEYCIVHNFYTYACMEMILGEYENMIKAFDIDVTCAEESKTVKGFLKNFVLQMRTMMKENPQTDLISVMGP